MVDEEPDSPNVVSQGFGEGQGFANQPRNPLSKGVVETLDVVGQAGFFIHLMVAFVVEDGGIGFPEVGVGLGIQITIG